ncbi:hypothetical protein F4V47_09250 [Lactococcus garvieae subsp. garvieae]|uniref:hypothetical protein n=1 Tax=Lactococcus garvieae TaxID=1363 RepID=UPI0005A8CEFB|nr:hypothetical protein [Lactococcus garvieae]KAA8710642.1 hypothetical protein F4V47_09250 [Lactococcus garvieae subsp. garvieae]MDG6191288.1 hypothetical protein [Lactococcus garvieae]PCS02936.1 hypothetical protein RU85_GL001434 [Lactococcus garvieae]QPR49440.1 hypothetical protein I6G86_03010 [Lactococcus garvieae]
MNQEELTALVINEIEKLGIDYRPYNLDNQHALINNTLKAGSYNQTTATPFDHAHEYMHAYYKDDRRENECDTLSRAEKRANKEAVLMLWDWFVQRGGTFDDIYMFCQVTGCPYEMTNRLIRSMCCDNCDKSFKECAVEYLSQFDVITRDNLNIYNFLDYYDYHYNAFEEAKSLMWSLCWFELV